MRRAVLAFFDARRRALPWRTTGDPYRIWISEVMLQQTRVETVIPYYERWLARFPALEQLAEAGEDDVLCAWEGLGYYSRARNLHRAARAVRERHGGQLPRSARELRELPGVGEYTAGAVASIAFGEPEPAVDGNVRRVLSRLLDADLSPAALQQVARTLVPARRPGDFNQGLMELGATLCRPRTPRCGSCPVHGHCRARAAGTQALRPARSPRRALPEHQLVTLVLRSPAGLLLTRADAGLLARMWRLPATPLTGDVRDDAASAIRRLTGSPADPALHGIVSHTFSHRREHYHVASATLPETPALPGTDEWRWFDADALRGIPLPAAQRRILGRVLPTAA